MGFYDYKGDKSVLQAQSDRIFKDGIKNDTSAARIRHDADAVGLRDGQKLSQNFKPQATRPDPERQDKQIANAMNGLVDPKTGQMDPAKMEAAGLSARAQRELIAAQETAFAITTAAGSTGKMSAEGLRANHDRTLVNLARENPELVQYAMDTRRQQAVQMAQSAPAAATPMLAQLDIAGP